MKKFFRKTCVQIVTLWLVRILTHKNADEKEHTVSLRRKTDKSGYYVNSPLLFYKKAKRWYYALRNITT